MKRVHVLLLCAALGIPAACRDGQTERKLAPLEAPVSSAAAADTTPAKTELEKPPATVATSAAPAVAPTQPGVGTLGPLDVEAAMREIGPISVIDNDEAKKKADFEITSQNAEAELQRLKDEIGG
jgi:hypothetical protein